MAGDVEARSEFDTAYPFLVTAAERTVRKFFRFDPSQIDDAVAETMARVFEDWWPRVHLHDNLVVFVAARAKNVCLEHVRKDDLRLRSEAVKQQAVDPHLDLAWATALSASIGRELDRLSRRQRDVAVLHYLMDCDEETTAAAMNKSIESVRKAAQDVRSRAPLLFFEVLVDANEAGV